LRTHWRHRDQQSGITPPERMIMRTRTTKENKPIARHFKPSANPDAFDAPSHGAATATCESTGIGLDEARLGQDFQQLKPHKRTEQSSSSSGAAKAKGRRANFGVWGKLSADRKGRSHRHGRQRPKDLRRRSLTDSAGAASTNLPADDCTDRRGPRPDNVRSVNRWGDGAAVRFYRERRISRLRSVAVVTWISRQNFRARRLLRRC